MTRQFTATEAHREAVPLIIGLVGPSGGGKTWSALELATGIQSVVGGDIHVIDTENKRATYYADNFAFKHVPFEPPFASADYLDAIQQSAANGAKTIIVDSMSHEHESVGGMLDYQDAELRRMAGDDYGTRKAERFNMLAWQKPKAARRRLLQGLTRVNANLILCFRAKQTSKPGKEKYEYNGQTREKNVVIPMGYMPIAGDEFVFECSMAALLLPGSEGVPEWSPENPGERMAVKLPKQFEWLRGHGQLNADAGARLARWAQGSPTAATPTPATKPQQTAAEWLDGFLADVAGATDADALTAIEKRASKLLARLASSNAALHERAVAAIGDRRSTLPGDPFGGNE